MILSPRPALRRLAPAVFAILVIGCQDKHLRELNAGISKDSTLKILSDGVAAKGDTIPNIYRHNHYLVDGKLFDIYLFDAQDRKLWADPLVPDGELTPVVVVDGALDGWGWDHMDELAYKYRIQLRAGSAPIGEPK